MKKSLIVLFVAVSTSAGIAETWSDEDRRIETEQISDWKQKLGSVSNLESSEQILELSLGVRNLGHRKQVADHRVEIDELYTTAQTKLLAIPGHAEYYNKKIREAYHNLKDLGLTGSANRFDTELMYGLKTLEHLPSPETVQVLGEMLPEEWQVAHAPGSIDPPPLGIAAVDTLAKLPFRNPPTPPFPWHLASENLPAWREWYASVKSGTRSFSFIGQKVEYRFKPDGTWENLAMTNPPNDAPRPAGPKDLSSFVHGPSKSPKAVWPWLVALVTMVVGIAAALRWKGKQKRDEE